MSTSIIMVILAVGMLLVGIIRLRENAWLKRHGTKAKGIVPSLDKDAEGISFSVVRYMEGEGEWVTRRLSIGSKPPRFSVGEKVPHLYDPEDPRTVELDSAFSLKVAPIILIAGGLGFLAYVLLFEFDTV